MSEWPRNQDYNRIAITTAGPESIGAELSCAVSLGPSGGAWGTANFAVFTPFVVYQPFTAVYMQIFNGATVSGNVDVGIYDDQANRLVSSGSTAQAGTSSLQKFDITDTTLRPGVYFMALAFDNAVSTVFKWVSSTVYQPAFGVYGALSSFPLPAAATWVNAGTNSFPQSTVWGRTAV